LAAIRFLFVIFIKRRLPDPAPVDGLPDHEK
jgi:hypothetical protein